MKFLIADDEVLVRITVIKALNDLGIQLDKIYQANCGDEMIKILTSEPIDIAFVDIKMPDISGLDAIKACLDCAPSTSFYILTGYGTFEYATQALRLGVKDFLLKPLDTQVLVKILNQEQTFIESKRMNARAFYDAKIKGILLGEINAASCDDLYCLPCFCTYDCDTQPQLDILYQAESMYSTIKTVMIHKPTYSYITFCTSSPQYTGSILSDIRSLLEQTLTQQENTLISFFYVNSFIPFSEINNTFTELEYYSSQRIVHGLNKLYCYNEKFSHHSKNEQILCNLLQTLHQKYAQGLYMECSDLVKTIITEMKQNNIFEKKAQLQHINYYFSVAFPSPQKQLYIYEDFSNYFETLLNALLDTTQTEEFDIQQILTYIQQHYTEDISINAIASEFHISPNYLSSRFRKETNIRFTDYLTNLRITRATQLLAESNLQIKEIAFAIGYCTASHFIRTFAKTKGITPTEYREQIRFKK